MSKKDPFNLITTVTTKPVTAADNHFVLKSINQAERVGGKISQSWQDGAYSSATNRAFFESQNITAYFPALAGKQGCHQFEWQIKPEQPDEKILLVTDTRDGKTYIATPHINKHGKQLYKVVYDKQQPNGSHVCRYFTLQEIANYFKRCSIEQIPKEILDRRANVEATIWQVFCKYGKKTRYRGLIVNHHMVLGRCFWTNCQRITKHLTIKAQKQLFLAFLRLSRFLNRLGLRGSMVANFQIYPKLKPNIIRLCQRTFIF